MGTAQGGIQKFDLADDSLAQDLGGVFGEGVRFLGCTKSFLFAASETGQLKQFNIEDCAEVGCWDDIVGGEQPVGLACALGGDKWCYVASAVGLAVFNVETGEITPPICMPHFKFTAITLAPNGKHLYAGSKDGVVLEFNCQTIKFTNSVADDLNVVIEHLLVSSNNKSLLVVDANSVMLQYKCEDRSLECNHGEIHRGRTKAISMTRDGMFLFSCCSLGGLRQFGFLQRKVLKTWSPFDRADQTGHELHIEGFNCMVMAHGRLIAGDSNGKISEIQVLDSVYDQQSIEVLKSEGDELNLGKFSGLVLDKSSADNGKFYVCGKKAFAELEIGSKKVAA